MKRKPSAITAMLLIASLLCSLLLVPNRTAYASDEYDTLRLKLSDVITGGTSFNPLDPDIAPKITALDTNAQQFWSTMDKSAGRTYLWSELGDPLGASMNSTHVSGSYSRLQTMATAYSTNGSALYQNATLRADIISAMDWMYTNRYNTSVPKRGYGNWFDWQISSPLSINAISVLLYPYLSSTQINNWQAVVDWQLLPLSSSNTGANRVWTCNIMITGGVLAKNSTKITNGVNGISPVFDYVTSGEGFYSDGSFLQHTALIPYNAGYGRSLLDNLTQIMYLIAGSTWDFTDPDLGHVYEWIYNAYEPLLYKDNMMEMVNGRNIARVANDNLGVTTVGALGSSLVRLAYSAPNPADAARYKSMIKQWMSDATSPTPYASLGSIQLIQQTKAIMNDASIVATGDLYGNKQYPNMARAVQRRPGFAFGVSMSSGRVGNYENVNTENIKGWHTGDGMTYLYNTDIAQYHDAFWPTVDSHRLAGTTVVQNSEPGGQLKNGSNWVGGTDVGGLYGVTGMQVIAPDSSMSAYKSWFQFDDEIVNLGAGIQSSVTTKPVETIIENRKLNSSGNNALTVGGTTKSASLGWSETMSGVSWMHLAGNTAGADIGYYFPTATTVKGLRQARTANWNSINTYYNDLALTPEYFVNYTRNFMTLWLDHGNAPTAGSYSYVLLPNKTTTQVANYAASPDVTIIENSTQAQAVRENNLNALGINFWQNATKTVSGITSNKKASVMVRTSENGTEVSISDPTMENTGTIQLTLTQSLGPLAYKDSRIAVSTSGGTTTLTVNVSGAAGKSIKAFFAAPVGGAVTGYAVNEDFNSLTLGSLDGQNGWTFDNGGAAGQSVVVSPVNGAYAAKSLKVTTTSTSGGAVANRIFSAPQDGYITAEATVTADDNNWKNALVIADNSLTSGGSAVHLIMQNGKIWGYNGSTQTDILTGTTNGQPYRLKVVINASTKKFNVYVGDVLRASNWSYRYAAVNTLDKFSTSIAGNASSMSVDDVKISYAPLTLSTVIDTDFDGLALGNLNGQGGWTFDNGGVSGNTGVVQIVSGLAGNKAAKLTTTSTSGKAEAYQVFTAPAGSALIAEATVTADDNNWKNALVLGDSSLTSNSYAAHIIMQNGKIWGYNGGTQTNLLASTVNGEPYRLKIVINTSTQKFDVYINGELRGSQWNYRYSGLTKVDKIISSIAGNASSMSIDDVKVSYKP
ncbi:polysaccharide lyase 8 family protein [Paenibacillus ferrarius]|uniref:polysaccharide lyase 8 family protein n=1 Tax=Paenibacillus ferrarius TaxID=1469647 RepID=UPI003D2A8340